MASALFHRLSRNQSPKMRLDSLTAPANVGSAQWSHCGRGYRVLRPVEDRGAESSVTDDLVALVHCLCFLPGSPNDLRAREMMDRAVVYLMFSTQLSSFEFFPFRSTWTASFRDLSDSVASRRKSRRSFLFCRFVLCSDSHGVSIARAASHSGNSLIDRTP
jgi:hypothetical protein